MDYAEWSKSRELARTLTTNFAVRDYSRTEENEERAETAESRRVRVVSRRNKKNLRDIPRGSPGRNDGGRT